MVSKYCTEIILKLNSDKKFTEGLQTNRQLLPSHQAQAGPGKQGQAMEIETKLIVSFWAFLSGSWLNTETLFTPTIYNRVRKKLDVGDKKLGEKYELSN